MRSLDDFDPRIDETAPLAAAQYGYDADGRKVLDVKATAFDGSGAATGWEGTTTAYTPTSKVASITDSLNEVTATSYDALDRVYQVTDPIGRVTQTNYDAAGQKTADLRAVGTSLQQTYGAYSYGLDGEQLTVTDANGNLTTMTYDGFNRLYQEIFPSTNRGAGTSDSSDYEQYAYDANGNRTSLRERDGNSLSYQYDALNREIVKTAPYVGSAAGYNVFTGYDLAGRPLYARFRSTSGPGVVYTYDAAGRRLTETTNGLTLTSGYDQASNRTSFIHPDSATISFTHNDPVNGTDPTGLTDYNCSGGAGTSNCNGGAQLKAGDTVATKYGSFSISQGKGFTLASPISMGSHGTLSDKQVAGVVFNETRSLSGSGLGQARQNVANAVMNGDERLGDRRPITAPSDARVPAAERGTYDAAMRAVQQARAQRSVGYDPTGGSMNFNLRRNDYTGPFQGHPLTTQTGPFSNSFPTSTLPSNDIYVNTYGNP